MSDSLDAVRARHGYRYTIELCDAIDAATPTFDLSHHGTDLSGAVARDLYVSLVNDGELLRRFAGQLDGDPGEPYTAAGPVDAAVAQTLLGERVSVSRRRRLKTAGRRALVLAEAGAAAPAAAGAVCLLVHNDKFARFLAPLAEATGRPVVTLSAAELPPSRRPRLLAAGLRERPRLAHLYDRFLAALASLRPAVVVVAEGNSPHDELANRAAASLGIPCICVQHGWSPIVHSGFRRFSFERMLVWGDRFAELLAPHNPGQRFVATGNHALAPGEDAARLAALLAGRPAVGFYAQATSQLIVPAHRAALFDLIRRFAENRPGAVALVREHPGWPLTAQERAALARDNVLLAPPHEYRLADVLCATVATVSIYSTTLLESAALGRPALVANPTSLPRYSPDLEELGAGVERRDPGELLPLLERLVDEPGERAAFADGLARTRERFFSALGGEALERIAAEVEDAAR